MLTTAVPLCRSLQDGLLSRIGKAVVGGGVRPPFKHHVYSTTHDPPPAQSSTTVGASINTRQPLLGKQYYDEDEDDDVGYPTAQLDILLSNLSEYNSHGKQTERSLIQIETLRQLIQLLKYDPDTRSKIWETGHVTELLKHKDINPLEIQKYKNKALALLGYVPPYVGRGLRILSLDGGGTRGLISIILLHHLEKVSGLKIDQMFDYVGGTSTGSIIASLLFVNKSSPQEAQDMYHELSKKIFRMNNLLGLGQLFINQSFYDSRQLEKQIRIGPSVEREMIDTSEDPTIPKMCFVSTLVNRPVIEPFLFTNYQHHPTRDSNYRYRFNVSVWKSIMASTAAPGYFEEVNVEKYILQDGALLSNNPSAIALHEARLLWGSPESPPPIQCLISLGTGRYVKRKDDEEDINNTSLREKLTKIVASATDTEAVHIVLQDLLPPLTYFRFNPLLSDAIALDDAKPEHLRILVQDTMRFIEKNKEEFERAAESLKQEKTIAQRAQDWYNEQWRRVSSTWRNF